MAEGGGVGCRAERIERRSVGGGGRGHRCLELIGWRAFVRVCACVCGWGGCKGALSFFTFSIISIDIRRALSPSFPPFFLPLTPTQGAASRTHTHLVANLHLARRHRHRTSRETSGGGGCRRGGLRGEGIAHRVQRFAQRVHLTTALVVAVKSCVRKMIGRAK